jgi:dynein heavy chain
LQYVKQLFNKAIAEAKPCDDLEERLGILIDLISRILYTNISRGLFERDKLIYSFLIATSIQKQAGEIDTGVWNAFLRGPTVMSAEESAAKPTRPELISELLWDTLYSGELRSTG